MKKIKACDYIKVVGWSEVGGCFIGSAPPLIGPCCHGKDEVSALRHLCEIVDDWVSSYEKEGKALPEASSGKEYSGKFVLRVGPELHRLLVVRAMNEGSSLNNYCAKALKKLAA